ncbi:hypothetical protein [Slackia equolifaciens]|uniref:hypothetical protein n=1 Tax=Slackia equolifaciens TaxID=498718 RepID=UPI0011CDDAEC|nr:hypothetical protein [Slackia equolifaciens]
MCATNARNAEAPEPTWAPALSLPFPKDSSVLHQERQPLFCKQETGKVLKRNTTEFAIFPQEIEQLFASRRSIIQAHFA